MCERNVKVNLENGLHLAPCSAIAKVSSGFDCDVRIVKGDLSINAKDIFEVIQLAAEYGTTLLCKATGPDAPKAIQALADLFESNFEGIVPPEA